MASFLQARRNFGKWLIRIEDIDPPREVPGSASGILADLARLGMHPDEPVLYQSTRIAAYRDKCTELVDRHQAFHCTCSRSMLHGLEVYPGTCRNRPGLEACPASIRIKVDDTTVGFRDGLQGYIRENLRQSCGDFVIWRADNLPAYQLAVVVDDSFQNISEVVRGADLLSSTTRQLYLQASMGLNSPAYTHIPVATLGGQKLSKQLGSATVASQDPVTLLTRVLRFLGHQPPRITDLDKLWSWSLDHWDIAQVPAIPAIAVDHVGLTGA